MSQKARKYQKPLKMIKTTTLIIIIFLLCISYGCELMHSNHTMLRFSLKNNSSAIDNICLKLKIGDTPMITETLTYSEVSEVSTIIDKHVLVRNDSLKLSFQISELGIIRDTILFLNNDKIIHFSFHYDSLVKTDSQLKEDIEIYSKVYPDSIFRKTIITGPTTGIFISDINL